jgi:hypothetical protein
MTDDQNRKYWRRWSFVCRQNHWRWVKGRLIADAVKDAGPHHQAVWRIAEMLAEQSCRAIAAEDLRHACNVHAFGRDMSHVNFTNDQFDRLLLLWGNERQIRGLLVYSDDIAAQIYWDDANRSKKESLIRSIKAAAADEYICSITQDLYGTIYWEDLDLKALLGLLRKIKGNAPASAGQPF